MLISNKFQQKFAYNWVNCSMLLLFLIGMGYGIFPLSAFAQVGLMPVPSLNDVQVQAEVTFDSNTGWYTYRYSISNPAKNTGKIWKIEIDTTQATGGQSLDSIGLALPIGPEPPHNAYPFDQQMSDLQPLDLPPGTTVIPFGLRVPSGWGGSFGRNGFAGFSTRGLSANILPGQTRNGFELISPGLPVIRGTSINPWWVFLVDDHETVTREEKIAAGEIERKIIFHTLTLGPSAVIPGSFTHWNQLRDDLGQAIQLGWVPDAALANNSTAQLASARQSLDAEDGTLAKTRLQTLLDTFTKSNAAQRRQEAHDLVRLNVQSLIDNTPDTPIPFEPKADLTPKKQSLSIGTPYILTATLINLGDDRPIADFFLSFQVTEGPHAGLTFEGSTDTEGKIRFNYTGTQLGTDRISLIHPGLEVSTLFGAAEVTWSGGPDLVVPFFVPPLIKSEGGKRISIIETTANIGNTPSAPSKTRYFLSSQETIDPATARVIGERSIPALSPGEEQGEESLALTLPGDLPPGRYSIAACADPEGTVVELNEENNCSFSRLTRQTIVVPMEMVSNLPPDCSKAFPSATRLWPPNHKLATVAIQGVTDPENDPIKIRVTRITQDEPVNGLGDGDTGPDGFGVGTSQAQIRAERSGTGNGRVYAVAFTAEDGRGGSCNGTVQVGVPHDQGKGSVPIDDGQRFDSTLP